MSTARLVPPLPNLRVFETAARHASFKSAALELHVTPSAVSHAVSGLESALGVKLFHRHPRRVVLTDAGRSLHRRLVPIFDGLQEATAAVAAWREAEVLTLVVPPAFARAWLLPRLRSFIEGRPDIDIRLRAATALADMLAADVDSVILYGREAPQDLAAERLMGEDPVPLCHPDLTTDGRPLTHPRDLLGCRLIHTETKIVTWSMWLRAAGLEPRHDVRGLYFNRADLSLEAARAGLGVALESRVLAQALIAEGRLAVPFTLEEPIAGEGAYFFATRPSKAREPKVRAFRDWLAAEAAAHARPHQSGAMSSR